MMMEEDAMNYGSMPFLRPASRQAKKEEVRRCLEELRSVLSGNGVPFSGNTTLETLKATIETLTKVRHEVEHRDIREDGFRLSGGHQPLPYLDENSYMLRISLEEGEILSVDRNLLDLLNYPEQSWRTCQLASFLCIADIPCLLSCLMRLQKRRQLIRSAAADAVDPGKGPVEKKAEEERPLEDSSSKELMSERCMFRLRVGPSVSQGTYSLDNRNTLMVPFVVEITLWPTNPTGQLYSMCGGTTSSDRTRIAMMTASSETTSFVGSSMRSSSGTAQAHMSREHVRMTLHRLNHAYQKSSGERKNGVRDGANEERPVARQKPVSFSSCLRRSSGLIVMASMESDLPVEGEELFKEVALAAALGYLPQDIYAGLTIFDVVHPADLKDLLEPLKKVISPHTAGTRKPWISSPPVRWRCLNSAHALIETRFRLSDNAQSIFCRHRVIMEPPVIDNFFDRVDVQLGQLEIKDGDGAEAAKLCSLREEWRGRFKVLMSAEAPGGGEGGAAGETEQWSVPRRPSLRFSHMRAGDMASGELGAASGAEPLPAGAAAAKEKKQAAQQPLSQHSQHQPHQPQQPPASSEGSQLHRRLSGKDSCRHRHARRRATIVKEPAHKTQEVPGDLCYDTWSHLERVQGYLASVAGIESTTSPPSHVHTISVGASILEAAQAQSGRGSSLATSNLAPQDYQMEPEMEPEPEQRMQTDAMAAAMAAAAAAAVGMSPTWSEDLATTSAASLTVENLARHTREQEMAYKRHLWRHLQRENERAAADRTEPKREAPPPPRRMKRRRLNCRGPRDHDLPLGPNGAPPPAEAEPCATKRPYLAAPPSMFSYMWMIPVVPPVPPYLLVPNIDAGVGPTVPPMMPTAHYPPGWDVGVLSNEWTDEDTFEDDATSSDDGLGAEATCEAERLQEKRRSRRKGRSRAERLSDGPDEAEESSNWQAEGPGHFSREPAEPAAPLWRVPEPLPRPPPRQPEPKATKAASATGSEKRMELEQEACDAAEAEAEEVANSAAWSPRDTSACSSSLFLYDDSSGSNSARQAGRKPQPFWMYTNSSRPVLRPEESMTYQVPVPEASRRHELLFKCHMNRLQQPEMVTYQLLEMLDLEDGLQMGDGASDDGMGAASMDDDDQPDVDRIISHLLVDVDSTFSSITSSCNPSGAMMQVSDDGEEDEDRSKDGHEAMATEKETEKDEDKREAEKMDEGRGTENEVPLLTLRAEENGEEASRSTSPSEEAMAEVVEEQCVQEERSPSSDEG